MTDGEAPTLDQDMTIARDDFLRCLAAAVDHVPFVVTGQEIRYDARDRGWRMVLTPLPDLALGLFRLPRQRVQVFLNGYDETATRRFLERFELYFRRGGG